MLWFECFLGSLSELLDSFYTQNLRSPTFASRTTNVEAIKLCYVVFITGQNMTLQLE